MNLKHNKSIGLAPTLHNYLISHSYRENEYLTELFHATYNDERSKARAGMCSPFDSAAFLQMLVRLINARHIVEVGTFTGFTALAMALATEEGARLDALDVEETYVSIGRPIWEKAGVSSKINVHIAPALETLAKLDDEFHGTVDMVFIDANKGDYVKYYDMGVKLLRSGGIVVIDNVLWGGRVIDENDQSADTVAIREVNDFVHKDPRVDISMIPLSDGVTIARKK